MTRFVHIPKELVGATGRRYCFKELLQSRPHLGSVWVARHGHEQFVLKDIPVNIHSNFSEEIWPRLRQDPSASLRLPIDTTPGRRTFVYDYLKDDFLHLVKTNLSMGARRQILKTTLKAIAELHSRDIVHLGIRGKLEGRT
jgi:hypothetical protein